FSNRAQNLFVRNSFWYKHRNVASHSREFLDLAKLVCQFIAQEKIGVQLGNVDWSRRARFRRRKLSAKTNHLIIGKNIDGQRKIRKFPGAERQIWNDAVQRALQVE